MADPVQIPVHIGCILDGNRRWAVAEGLPTLEGHKQGYENLKTIAGHAFKRGVRYVSAFVFSTENWKRSEEEVTYLMNLVLWMARHKVKELDKENIKILFLGERDKLSPAVLEAMESVEKRTAQNTGGTLVLCLNYGGQQEIVAAVNAALADNPSAKRVTIEEIQKHLYHPEIPAIDLIIRTSGEQRLSNFMLWRAAYSELYFVDKHWPALSVQDFDQALAAFASRERRFGGDHKPKKS